MQCNIGNFKKCLEKSVSIFVCRQTEKQQNNAGTGNEKEMWTLYQNYAVTSPIVVGWWNKKIIFPVQDYEERELVTILYHELSAYQTAYFGNEKDRDFLKTDILVQSDDERTAPKH